MASRNGHEWLSSNAAEKLAASLDPTCRWSAGRYLAKYHVWKSPAAVGCGAGTPNEPVLALCDVPVGQRCMRGGCRERWPTAES